MDYNHRLGSATQADYCQQRGKKWLDNTRQVCGSILPTWDTTFHFLYLAVLSQQLRISRRCTTVISASIKLKLSDLLPSHLRRFSEADMTRDQCELPNSPRRAWLEEGHSCSASQVSVYVFLHICWDGPMNLEGVLHEAPTTAELDNDGTRTMQIYSFTLLDRKIVELIKRVRQVLPPTRQDI